VCGLLKDADAAVRTRAFAALGASVHPLIIDEVMSLCFAEQAAARTPEEQEVMFRALGKAAGAQALPRLRQSVEKKQYLPGARTRLRREKLLAITALRYIPGEDARRMVERLADDGDTLVKAKAQHVLKRPEGMGSDVYSRAAAASGQSGEDV
jgi:hypothetical protein